MMPRPLLVATPLLLVLLLMGCSGSGPGPLPGELDVEPDSAVEAQDVLDAATDEFMTTLTGTFHVSVERGLPAEVDGTFDAVLPAYASTVTILPGRPQERVLRTTAIGDEVFSHVSSPDGPTCWIRLDAADLAAAGVSGGSAVSVHPATSMLLAPEAVGIVSAGDGVTRVRLDVLWSDAASVVAATAVNQMTAPVPDDVRVPAVAEVRGGLVRSIAFSWSDVIDVAEAEGEGYLEALDLDEHGVEDLRAGLVEVSYADLGEPTSIAPPAAESVVRAADAGTAPACAQPE